MDHLIYTAMSGADRVLQSMQIHANNMANAKTDGFRAEMEVAQSTAVDGYGYDGRHLLQVRQSAVNTEKGALQETGRELDVAIQGDGYFTVEINGAEAYTRGGSFKMSGDGALTLNGRAVMGQGGPIVLPEFGVMEIGSDGTVFASAPGEAQLEPVAKLAIVDAEAGELIKDAAGLLVTRSGAPLPLKDDVTVVSGHLEQSNVSPVTEMMATMTLGRDFEVQMRMFKAADDMADAGNRLIRG